MLHTEEDKSYQSGKKTYTVSSELKALAEKVAEKHMMKFGEAKIAYILVSPHISKTTPGKCSRSKDMYKIWLDADYIIEISENLWNHLDDNAKELLMEHELRHIHVTYNEKKGEYKYAIRKHDISDFIEMHKKHGAGWQEQILEINQSLYDLDRARGSI